MKSLPLRRVSLQRPLRRLLQIGDLHLKMRDIEDQVAVLDWVANQVFEHDVQVVSIAGDLAGDPRPYLAKPAERMVALEFMLCVAERGAHVLVCTGNHDVPQDWEWLSAVPGVTYCTRPETVVFTSHDPGVPDLAVHVLPHPDRAWISRGRKSKADVTEALHHALPTIIKGMDAAWEHDSETPRILVGHIGTRGCELREGQPLVGAEVELPVDAIPAGVDVALLNHIHYGQEHGGAVHVGSPWPTRNGEDEQKSVALWHVEEKRLERLETPHMRFETATIQWVPEGHAFKIVEHPTFTDDRTRLRVRVVYEEGEDVDWGLVQHCFPRAVVRSIDRAPVARRRERAPEVVDATGPIDKFLAYEEHEGRDVPPSLEDLASELCGTMGLLGGGGVAGAARDMRLLSVTLTDIGAPGTRVLDLTQYPDGPLAVLGPNGSGKTTLCEMSAPGGLWRQLPSRVPSKRGALIELACSRSSRIEVVYDYGGRELKAVHLLDAKARTAEATLYLDDVPFQTASVVSDGKLRTFDACVDQLLPSWESIAATRFWVQGGTGAWDALDGASRRTILRELLGLEGYQRVAAAAKARYEETSDERDKAAAKREALAPSVEQRERQQAELSDLCERIDDMKAKDEAARADVLRLEASLYDARAAADASLLREKVDHLRRLRTEVCDIAQSMEPLGVEREALAGQLREAGQREQAANAEARESAARAAAWRAQSGAVQSAYNDLQRAQESLRRASSGEAPRDVDTLDVSIADRGRELDDVRDRAQHAREAARAASAQAAAWRTQAEAFERARDAWLTARDAFEQAAGVDAFDVDDARARRDGASKLLDQLRDLCASDLRAQSEITALQQRREDIERRHGMVAKVPCGAIGEFATCPFLADAKDVWGELSQIETRLDDLLAGLAGVSQSDVAGQMKVLDAAQCELDRALRLDDLAQMSRRAKDAYRESQKRLDEMPTGDPDAVAAADGLDSHERRLASVLQSLRNERDLATVIAGLRAKVEELQQRVDAEQSKLDAMPLGDSEAETLAARVSEMVAEMRAKLADVRSEHDRLAERYAAKGDEIAKLESYGVEERWGRVPEHIRNWQGWSVAEVEADLSRARTEASRCSRELDQSTGRLAGLEQAIEESSGLAEQISRLEFKIERLSTQMDMLKRIQHAFGPRGIQAVLVHNAGPAVSDTANKLRDAADGGLRFRVDLVTVKEKADGSGFKDAIDLTVTNASNGLTCSMDNLSGGERDMVRAALALALALHHSELTGVRWQTAWADEAGAALTQENAHRWMRMIRSASDMLGLRQVLVVTHDPEVQRSCDAVIDIEQLDGEDKTPGGRLL